MGKNGMWGAGLATVGVLAVGALCVGILAITQNTTNAAGTVTEANSNLAAISAIHHKAQVSLSQASHLLATHPLCSKTRENKETCDEMFETFKNMLEHDVDLQV